ncbi:MAG: glycosyltransferase [Bdellovibrionaceae bacterium]|nr:glycosyltransferase [Pseudobdellovibrionaceae bacterium]
MIFQVWIFFSAAGMGLLSLKQLRFARHVELLKNVNLVNNRSVWPKISLIIPACNEGQTIGPALLSLLEMDYPSIEIIVVNDRSTDETGNVLADIALKHSSVKVVTVVDLPKDWLGKVHAQYKAMELATGDWILFTDADVHYGKYTLKKAIQYCEDKNLDFLTLIPHLYAKSIALKACMTQFLMAGSLGIDIPKMRDPKSKDAIGCGAFNLVRGSTYKKSPGLEWLKMEVVDDGSFALMIKKMGTRCDIMSGLDELKIEWYPSVRGYVKGLEKNAFSIFQYLPQAVVIFTVTILIWLLGLMMAPVVYFSWLSHLTLLASYTLYQFSNINVLRKISDFPAYIVLCLPASLLLSLFVVWRGMILFLWRGGIYWRSTFYTREQLIKNQRLKLIDYFFFNKSSE